MHGPQADDGRGGDGASEWGVNRGQRKKKIKKNRRETAHDNQQQQALGKGEESGEETEIGRCCYLYLVSPLSGSQRA